MIGPSKISSLRLYVDNQGRGGAARLAREIGVSRSYMNDLLIGRREPSLAIARKIALATAGAVPFESWKEITHPANRAATAEV